MGPRTANEEPVEIFNIGGTDNMMLAAGIKENMSSSGISLRTTSPGKRQQSHNEELTHTRYPIASLLPFAW
jgi:hypothetical protein